MSAADFDPLLSVFPRATDADTVTDKMLSEVIARIRSDELAAPTVRIRDAFANAGGGAAGKRATDTEKKRLPGVTLAGAFNRRENKHWRDPSSLVQFDLDLLSAETMAAARAQLQACPWVACLWASPSGAGLKGAVCVPWIGGPDPERYKLAWHAVTRWLASLELVNDQSAKDCARLAYLAHDPEAWHNAAAEPFDLDQWPEPAPDFARETAYISDKIQSFSVSSANVEQRALAYVRAMPPSVQGSSGSDAMMAVIRSVRDGFDLSGHALWSVIDAWNAERVTPPWSKNELAHALDSVEKTPSTRGRGWLRDEPALPARTPVHDSVQAEAERYLRGPMDDADPVHATIVCALLDGLKDRGLAVDANGSFRDAKAWQRVDSDHASMGREVAFTIRSKGTRVDSSRVTETLEVIAKRDAETRRFVIYAEHLQRPASPHGEQELRRWVHAVTGTEREADVQAMRHWLWQVKSRTAGRHGEKHLMPVIFGTRQGSGKSIAVARLCTPWAELFNADFAMENITDERCAPALARTVIGLWDELGGLARTDMEKLKHRLTGSVVSYRPMRSNQQVELTMLTSLIGTSNRRLVDLARDPTGARRFYEIEAQDLIDWDAINSINYNLLWQAVNQDEQAPGAVHQSIIAAEQTKLVWRDPIERWLTDEDDTGWPSVADLDGCDLGSARPSAGIPSSTLYGRFRRWCADAGEREAAREAMGRRLTELGWEMFRLPRAHGQAKAYRRPLIEKPAVHTVHNRAQTCDDGDSVHGVHGVNGHCLYEPLAVGAQP